MSGDITGNCHTHPFELASDLCTMCGTECCEDCLVWPFGPRKPICVGCALVAGGVRSSRAKPISRRERKRRRRRQAEIQAERTPVEASSQWVMSERFTSGPSR